MQDTAFYPNHSLNCGSKLLDLSTARVMGIVNITPDSFYDGGKLSDPAAVRRRIRKLIKDGADIIDIGANSSRPKAKIVGEKTEWKRLEPVLAKLLESFPNAIFSVDTFYSSVAEKAIDCGVHIINDISAGTIDKKMFKLIAKKQVPYIVMHMKGTPATMQNNPRYKNVTLEVIEFLRKKVDRLRQMGVLDIVVDPGFGFGKTVSNNYQLLRELEAVSMLDCPILVGLSRKSMICQTLGIDPEHALNGTTSLNTLALINGANILRVHDVNEAREVVQLYQAYKN